MLVFFFAAVAAGDAAYWFVGGAFQSHTQVRNALVLAQLVIGVAAMLWFGWRLRPSMGASQSQG